MTMATLSLNRFQALPKCERGTYALFGAPDQAIPAGLRPNISFLHFLGYGPAARNDSLFTVNW